MYAGQPGEGPYPGASPTLPATLPNQLRDDRREKTAAIMSGNYTPTSGPSYPGYKSVMDTNSAKPEPWIGPDGGMIGRGINYLGKQYQGYIDGKRDTMMKTMKTGLDNTFSPWAIDALATVGHAATEGLTGHDSDYEPKFAVNKVFQYVGLPKGSLWFPTQAASLGAKVLGGQELSPSEKTRGVASLLKSGFALTQGPGSTAAEESREFIDRNVDAGLETFK